MYVVLSMRMRSDLLPQSEGVCTYAILRSKKFSSPSRTTRRDKVSKMAVCSSYFTGRDIEFSCSTSGRQTDLRSPSRFVSQCDSREGPYC